MDDLQLEEAERPATTLTGRIHLYPLRYLNDSDDEVTVGRMDTSTYVVMPRDGAELVRRLEAGLPIEQAAAWYRETYQEELDIADFVEALAQLGFVSEGHTEAARPVPVRWQRLARALFSPLTLAGYLALVAAAVVVVLRDPTVLPRPRNLFFSSYLSVVLLALLVIQVPLVLLHEAAHALAARRLGLRSRLSVGRRLIYVVLQTNLDDLVIVPRRQRYLPMLAGIIVDVGVIAGFTVTAECLPAGSGAVGTVRLVLLAMAYLSCLRVLWQFLVFLETDVYHLVATLFGCLDLQHVARQQLANWCARALGRPRRHDPQQWHPRDRRAATPYAAMLVVGYVLCLVVVPLNIFAVLSRVISILRSQLSSTGSDRLLRVADAALFVLLTLGQLLLAAWLARRERHAGRATHRDQPVAA